MRELRVKFFGKANDPWGVGLDLLNDPKMVHFNTFSSDNSTPEKKKKAQDEFTKELKNFKDNFEKKAAGETVKKDSEYLLDLDKTTPEFFQRIPNLKKEMDALLGNWECEKFVPVVEGVSFSPST